MFPLRVHVQIFRTLVLLILCVALQVISQNLVYAQQESLIEKKYEGLSQEKNPQAAKMDIQNQAAQKISEQLIQDLIGKSKLDLNKNLIQNKIIKNSARYLPFSKPSNVIQVGEDFKMSVVFKVSLEVLKEMLNENALMNEPESIPVILPFISFVDRVQGGTFHWWVPFDKKNKSFLLNQGRSLEDSLQASFRAKNFFIISPLKSNLSESVPTQFQNEFLSLEDTQFFSKMYNAPILLQGRILLQKENGDLSYLVDVHLTAIQVSNNRILGEVSRQFKTESGAFEIVVDKKLHEILDTTITELAVQIFEASQRGSLGANIILLKIEGALDLPNFETIKEKIRTRISAVKNIKERFIAADSLSFEVDTAISADELAQKIQSIDWGPQKLEKISVDKEGLIFKIMQ